MSPPSFLSEIKFLYLGFWLAFILNLYSSIDDYVYPHNHVSSYSNYGGLGLIQNPNARFSKNGTLAFSWSHNDPYLRGSIIAYPFDWFEASFQYTDINNVLYSPFKSFSGSQSLKDKSFDVKIRLLKETSILPQTAVGVRDLGGTGLFASEYLVFSKRAQSNFDISFGIGWGNLNGNKVSNPLSEFHASFDKRNDAQELGGKFNVKNFFSGDAGYFGGIEYTLPFKRGLRVKLEYDGTNYQNESKIPLNQDSKYNLGIVYPWTKRLQTKLSFTRGNTVNFGFSYSLGLGKKNALNQQKPKRVKLDRSEVIKRVTGRSKLNLYKASLLYLREEGISLQKATLDNDEFHVVIAQSQFRSPALSAGRAMNIINQIAPDNVDTIKISEVNGGLGMQTITIPRNVYRQYEDINSPRVVNEYINAEPFLFKEEDFDFQPTSRYPIAFNSVGPELLSQIGGPDGFFFGDLKLTADSELLFSRNFSIISAFSYGLIDNMDTLKLKSTSVLPHVRTDIVKYLKQSRNFSIKRIQANYFKQLTPSIFTKLSGGIFEQMFAGYGGEILYRPYNKNFGIGLDAWKVYQREYDQMFDIRDYNTLTGHLSLYYHEPVSNILFTIKGGRYLAKDSGFTFDFSRIFRSGMRMGAFFSLTDISEEEFGEGSFDKGFYFWIPVELFSNRYLKRTFGWGLKPITRDGAQSLIYSHPLWGVTDPSNYHSFRRRFDDIYD